MYTLDKYNILKAKYGSVASWAIWNDKDLSDTSVIDKNYKELHSRYVLLGLNISKLKLQLGKKLFVFPLL